MDSNASNIKSENSETVVEEVDVEEDDIGDVVDVLRRGVRGHQVVFGSMLYGDDEDTVEYVIGGNSHVDVQIDGQIDGQEGNRKDVQLDAQINAQSDPSDQSDQAGNKKDSQKNPTGIQLDGHNDSQNDLQGVQKDSQPDRPREGRDFENVRRLGMVDGIKVLEELFDVLKR